MILKAEGRSPGRPQGSMRGERPVFFVRFVVFASKPSPRALSLYVPVDPASTDPQSSNTLPDFQP